MTVTQKVVLSVWLSFPCKIPGVRHACTFYDPAGSPHCWSLCVEIRNGNHCDTSLKWLKCAYFSGVISNFVSYVCKVATGRYGPSLGAVSISNLKYFNFTDKIKSLQKFLTSFWNNFRVIKSGKISTESSYMPFTLLLTTEGPHSYQSQEISIETVISINC